jgi:tetratricopeptide (TPR) repeat protein
MFQPGRASLSRRRREVLLATTLPSVTYRGWLRHTSFPRVRRVVPRAGVPCRKMQSPGSHDFLGTRRFVIRSRVGQGAVGVVYDAFDTERNARVALKTLRIPNPETLLSLKKEFRAVQDLRHANLVHVDELFVENGTWFFTMEFVDGTHFVRYVRPGDPRGRAPLEPASGPEPAGFDEARLRSSLPQLVYGIMALHDAGKVHRDIKPTNVLVTGSGRVVLLDFGVAGDLIRDADETDPGMVGTAAYMAPEQALGDTAGPAADWYALGVVLYEALTGRTPFYGAMHELIVQKFQRAPPPPSQLVQGVPRDLDELCMDLMRIAPEQRPKGRVILERIGADPPPIELTSGAHPLAVFVGREPELAALEAAHADVARGRTVTVLVHGDSGVGKSFLVRHFLGTLRKANRAELILDGRCLERESVPYKAVDGAVDQLGAHLASLGVSERRELLPPNAFLLSRAFPVLGRSIPSLVPESAESVNPQELRVRMFAAMRELLRRIAARRPIILAIDDLQWADDDSLALLAEITRPPGAPSMLLVATLRVITEERDEKPRLDHLASLRIEGDVRHLPLGQLAPEDARALALELSGNQVSGIELKTIVDEARGHPLFIDELVRQRSSLERLKVLKLDDALWFRVERLEPLARRLLEVVAVAGAPTPQGVAADAASIDLAQLFELSAQLRIERFVKTGGARPDDAIEPYHDRVREAVLRHLDPDARARWHARLAGALERVGSDDAEALATHWHAAGNTERAAEYASRAGDVATEALAFERAARLYRLALDLHTHPPEAARDLKRHLAEALANAGYISKAAEVNLALASECPAEAALDLRRRAAEQLLCSGRFDTGLEILRSVLDRVGVYFPRSPLAVICSVILVRLLLGLRGVSFRPRDPAQTTAAARVRADAAWSAGAGFAMSDNIRGAYFQTRNLLLCLRMGDPHRVSRALAMEVCFRSAGGLSTRRSTRALLAQDWELAREVGTPEALGMAHAASGYSHYMVGEWREAKTALASAEELFRDRCLGMAFMLGSARTMLYRVLGNTGELRELAARVPSVLRDAERQSDDYSFVNLQAGPMALLGLAEDQPQRVRDALASVGERLPSGAFLIQHYFVLVAQCQLDLYVGDGAAALGRLHAAWPALRSSLLLRVQAVRVMAYEQRCRCSLSAATARTASRIDLLRSAEADANALAHEGLAWPEASAAMLQGAIFAARGQAEEAKTRLEDAVARFTALGMDLHAAATRRRLGELVGGDEGAAHIGEADAWLATEGVRNPARIAAALVPAIRAR